MVAFVMSNQTISLGRIVHCTLSTGEIRPAIVVRCWDGHGGYPPGVVNLQVFLDGRNDSDHKGADISPFGTVRPKRASACLPACSESACAAPGVSCKG